MATGILWRRWGFIKNLCKGRTLFGKEQSGTNWLLCRWGIKGPEVKPWKYRKQRILNRRMSTGFCPGVKELSMLKKLKEGRSGEVWGPWGAKVEEKPGMERWDQFSRDLIICGIVFLFKMKEEPLEWEIQQIRFLNVNPHGISVCSRRTKSRKLKWWEAKTGVLSHVTGRGLGWGGANVHV